MTELNEAIEQKSSGYAGDRKPECLFDKITTTIFAIVCFSMSVLLTVCISSATIARYCFNKDLFGYEEWVKIFAFWLYFIGSAYGAFEGTHISADLVQSYCKPGKFRNFMLLLRNLITFGISCLFAWYGWGYFKFDMFGPLGDGRFTSKSVLWNIPNWWASGAIFIGLLFMAWYFGVDLIRSVRAMKGGEAK